MRSFVAISLFLAIARPQTIDPTTVSISLRDAWCRDQQASCPLLCTQQAGSASTTANSCNSKTLDWACVCAADHRTPNVSEYSQTIPYYECTEFANQCVAGCGLGNNACSNTCRTAHPCGAQNPTRVNISSSSSTSAGGSSATASSTGFDTFDGSGSATTTSAASTGSSTTTKSAATAAINLGQTYGLAFVIGGFFAGFTLLL